MEWKDAEKNGGMTFMGKTIKGLTKTITSFQNSILYGDKNYGNWFNKLGYNLDVFFSKLPLMYVFFARVIIYGTKK